MNYLKEALAAVSGLNSFRAVTLENIAPDGESHLLGAGIIGFVSDEFVASAKTPPYFWIGSEVTRLTLKGKTPFSPCWEGGMLAGGYDSC